MSCPDPTPVPGSVEDLESQARMLQQRINAKRNEEYVSSGRLAFDIDTLFKRFGGNGSKAETLEEKLKVATAEAIKRDQAYTESLWKK